MMPLKQATITKAYKESPPAGITYRKGYHTGIDFISPFTDVLATLAGSITEVGWDENGWGRYVILRTSDGKYDLIHAHLDKAYVVRGQKIVAGDKLGLMGATGQVTGAHLHYEVRKAPWTNKDDVDVAAWLGIENKRGLAVSVQSKPIIPTGPNIFSFKSGNGWLEVLPERDIAHQDEYNYVCFWKDGRVTEHRKNQPIVEWK
ncbi:M23 family metallopeptidase [Dehalobacter sp. 14DCB1]|uniref:M23 family metallopeptidase n=1 Tax=Dehalobacter sp. 14DCB1 TaxID=2070227 RepID=UPI0010506CBD|nr:M23 family metallopeptidase [Dehalobacter sp. 14DCB1]TCX53823.1 hypothetical protein C1I36_03575 [Dehalobacter sp. 14DCB1]